MDSRIVITSLINSLVWKHQEDLSNETMETLVSNCLSLEPSETDMDLDTLIGICVDITELTYEEVKDTIIGVDD